MNRKVFICFVGVLLCTVKGFTQQNKIDSLQRVISLAKEDSVKVFDFN